MKLGWFLFSFRGRISRTAWWIYFAGKAVMLLAGFLAFGFLLRYRPPSDTAGTIGLTIALPVMGWIVIATGVKRLHDIGASGAWILLLMLLYTIPFVGLIAALVVNGCAPGTPGANRFGEAPKTRTKTALYPPET